MLSVKSHTVFTFYSGLRNSCQHWTEADIKLSQDIADLLCCRICLKGSHNNNLYDSQVTHFLYTQGTVLHIV